MCNDEELNETNLSVSTDASKCLFDTSLEDDPLVFFHGTSKRNLESILDNGFLPAAKLPNTTQFLPICYLEEKLKITKTSKSADFIGAGDGI